ncbi:hypothetical protein L0668_10300 [Paraglaciecola aquimarina]|uniref:Uncharacterized protein n=1 Tax=Paraglaciecola algarum TaxID=3050085 RepID=A0ABS9D7Y5_9ALTE|nr:hypothetical protein [Paraglaciecola sp. G1-23]MCF2948497.1 hypothetical protein [Paraglaciecola sp. G1-23]
MKLSITASVSIIVLTSPTYANDPLTHLSDQVPRIAADEVTPPQPTDNESYQTGWSLIAGSDKEQVSFKYAPITGKNNFAITLAAPLNSDGVTTLFDSKTDAFANSTTITASFNRAVITNLQFNSLHVEEICRSNFKAFDLKEADECNTAGDISELLEDLDTTQLSASDIASINDFKDEVLSPIWFYGGSISYGREEFKYFEVESITTHEENEKPYGISLSATYLKPTKYALIASLQYQKGFTAESAVTRCPTLGDSATFVECIEAQKGLPTETTNKNLKLGGRFSISIFGRDIGLAPDLTYDFEDDERSVAFPVYLFKSKEGGMNGGVRVDYESGGEGSTVSLFIGQTFKLY